MLRRITDVILAVTVTVAPLSLLAQAPSTDAQEPSSAAVAELEDVEPGAPVALELSDGTRMVGLLNGRDVQGILIQPSASDEPRFVPYSSIVSVSVRGEGWSALPTSGWVVVGASLAALVVLLAAAFRAARARRVST